MFCACMYICVCTSVPQYIEIQVRYYVGDRAVAHLRLAIQILLFLDKTETMCTAKCYYSFSGNANI